MFQSRDVFSSQHVQSDVLHKQNLILKGVRVTLERQQLAHVPFGHVVSHVKGSVIN